MRGWFLVYAGRLGAELSGVFPARQGSVSPTGWGASVCPTASAGSDEALPTLAARDFVSLPLSSPQLFLFAISPARSPAPTFPFPKSSSPVFSTFSKLFFLPSLDVSSEPSLSPLPLEPKSGTPRARVRGAAAGRPSPSRRAPRAPPGRPSGPRAAWPPLHSARASKRAQRARPGPASCRRPELRATSPVRGRLALEPRPVENRAH